MIRPTLVGLAVVLVGLGMAGCGSDSSSTPTPTFSPGFVITNLRVTTAPAHGVVFTVDFNNANGAAAPGTCDATTNLGELSMPIQPTGGTAAGDSSGTIRCESQFNTASGTPLSGTFSLTDPAANTSNALSFSTTLP